MAYEKTDVAVSKSQDQLRKLIMGHKGFAFAAISQRPNGVTQEISTEGFEAQVLIDGKPFQIRVIANLKRPNKYATEKQKAHFLDQEERRIWRVLYYHMKSVFEAADTGVMEFRELMLPYVVTGSGRTVAEILVPRLDAIVSSSRLLSE
jgi:hypothetical protein